MVNIPLIMSNFSFKFLTLLIGACCCLWAGCVKRSSAVDKSYLDVMTFNIRYGLANDGEDSWEFRKGMVMGVIVEHAPDLIGLQEALQFQMDEIRANFPEYGSIGIGRDPGGEGEYAAILYLKERFMEVESDTFWLSETPEVPSTHWGNKHLRICTWARLLDRKSSPRGDIGYLVRKSGPVKFLVRPTRV